MDPLKIRVKLRKMGKTELLKLVTKQKISSCLVGGTLCRFHLHYKEYTFCASEIVGHGCQLEKLKRLEEVYSEDERRVPFTPLLQNLGMEFLYAERKTAEFKVYVKDEITHSMVYLGRVIERRRIERGNNLKDLLNKAIKEYSGQVKDPTAIFLLCP